MAARTESLVGKLAIQDQEWRRGLSRAAGQWKSFSGGLGNVLSGGMQGVMAGVRSIGGMITSVIGGAFSAAGQAAQALGIGGVLSSAGIVAGIKNVSDLGGELSDVAAKTGIAVKDLVLLREQFRQGGIEAGDVTDYVRKMNESLQSVKKSSLFEALGLNREALLKGGALSAINTIIARVREVGKVVDQNARLSGKPDGSGLAAQQKALSEIFGSRKGIELMTIVADEASFSNARNMVGGMAAILGKNANDLDAISDNLFGGLPIKLQQAFTGFTGALIEPLKAATEIVTNLDFTEVGERIGKQLIWAWGVFQGLVGNDDLGKFLKGSLQEAFIYAASYLKGGLEAAWNSVFNQQNAEAVGAVFSGVFKEIGGLLKQDAADARALIDPTFSTFKSEQKVDTGSEEQAKAVLQALLDQGRSGVIESGMFDDKQTAVRARFSDQEMAKFGGLRQQSIGRDLQKQGFEKTTSALANSAEQFGRDLMAIKPMAIFNDELKKIGEDRVKMVADAASKSNVASESPFAKAGGIRAALTPDESRRNGLFGDGGSNRPGSANMDPRFAGMDIKRGGSSSEGGRSLNDGDIKKALQFLGTIAANSEEIAIE